MKKLLYLLFLIPSFVWADSKVSNLNEQLKPTNTDYMYIVAASTSMKVKAGAFIMNSNSRQQNAQFNISSGTFYGPVLFQSTNSADSINSLTVNSTFYTTSFGGLKNNEQYLYYYSPQADSDVARFFIYASTEPWGTNLKVYNFAGDDIVRRDPNDVYFWMQPEDYPIIQFHTKYFDWGVNGTGLTQYESNGNFLFDVNNTLYKWAIFQTTNPLTMSGGVMIDDANQPASLYKNSLIFGHAPIAGPQSVPYMHSEIKNGATVSDGVGFQIRVTTSEIAQSIEPPVRMEIQDNCPIGTCNTKFTDNIEVRKTMNEGAVRMYDTTAQHYVAIKASETVVSSQTYVMPATVGTDGQVMAIEHVNGTRVALKFADSGGGGGSSSLGVFKDGVQVTSPTAQINIISMSGLNVVQNGSTATIIMTNNLPAGSTTYLMQSSATATYLQQTSSTSFLTTSSATATYLTLSSATLNFLTLSSATANFITISSTSANYLTISSANANFSIKLATETLSGAKTFTSSVTVVKYLTIPNGAQPDINTVGHIGIDTTSGQFVYHNGIEAVVLSSTFTKSLNLETPVAGDFPLGFRTDKDVTVKSLVCVSSAATSTTIDFLDCAGSNGTSCNTLWSSAVCGTTEFAVGLSSDVVSGRRTGPRVSAISGTPGWLGVDVSYVEKRK